MADYVNNPPGAGGQMRLTGVGRRELPVSFCCEALFGGFNAQFGWLFFGFGMIFFWAFALHSTLWSDWKFADTLATASGRVIAVTDTHCSEGGSHGHRGTPIYRVDFAFTPVSTIARQQGTSYTVGYFPEIDQQVRVEYRGDNPRIARIQGMRSEKFGAAAVIVLIFPLIGLLFLLTRLREGLLAVQLLKYGRTAKGRLVDIVDTGVRNNNRTVFKITLAFNTMDGRAATVVVKSTRLKTQWDAFLANRAQVAPTPDEDILYDPMAPARNVALADLDLDLRLDEQGNIIGLPSSRGYAALILPGITIIGHGVYLLSLLHT